MNDEYMIPQKDSDYITLPVTFDYKGGRSANVRGKVIATIVIVVASIMLCILLGFNTEIEWYIKIPVILVELYIALLILRFIIYKELHFSDVYEELLEKDFVLSLEDVWQIFEVAEDYPYICYYKNGLKGLFVRMEMGTITGKSETVMYDHYEAISDAYNIAHSLNMNIVHIDYMDNVGNDERLDKLYEELYEVENPEMQTMLLDIYDNIKEEMTRNYASYDIYLFLTQDKVENFLYNVQNVCSKMTEGNFITYRIMDVNEIATAAKAIFNLNNFSVLKANENTLKSQDDNSGVVPIKVYHADGTVEEINKTMAEKRWIEQQNSRKIRDDYAKKKSEKQRRRNKKKGIQDQNEIDFSEDVSLFTPPEEIHFDEPENSINLAEHIKTDDTIYHQNNLFTDNIQNNLFSNEEANDIFSNMQKNNEELNLFK